MRQFICQGAIVRSLILAGLFLSLATACRQEGHEDSGTLRVVCTTGMVGDAVKSLLGDSLTRVKTLMGPGVDPHLYKASQGDVAALQNADIIVYNGLHLEGKMNDILKGLRGRQKVWAMAENLPEEKLINSTDYAGAYDPHIWFDVALWSEAVQYLADSLAQAWPERAPEVRKRWASYREDLAALHREAQEVMSRIPKEQRVLITAHDAFKYFGRAYDVEVRGLQGISTASEYGLRDVTELVQFAVRRNIPALFVESSVPARAVEAVLEGARQKGHRMQLGGELYSDAMGPAGTSEGTYTGMVRHNLHTIARALAPAAVNVKDHHE